MDLELDDKVRVVTGASKEIGLAVVRALAAEGAHSSARFHPGGLVID
jgi:NAD(P)-dependent dehydrogenase (short-subunit alcohol dehydrogenase family)